MDNEKSFTALGVSGLTLGVSSFILSIIPIFNIVAVLLAVAGVVLSFFGLFSAIKNKYSKKSSIFGLILSIVAVAIFVAMYYTAYVVIDDFINQVKDLIKQVYDEFF